MMVTKEKKKISRPVKVTVIRISLLLSMVKAVRNMIRKIDPVPKAIKKTSHGVAKILFSQSGYMTNGAWVDSQKNILNPSCKK